jgi:hypothetical protein
MRERLRSFAESSPCSARFEEYRDLPALRKLLVVEYFVSARDSRKTSCLALFSDRAILARHSDGVEQDSFELAPTVVSYWFRRFERNGLWELNDFSPAVMVLDGYSFILRGVDLTDSFPRDLDANVGCPCYAVTRPIRNVDRLLQELFSITPERIKWRNRLWRTFFFRLFG